MAKRTATAILILWVGLCMPTVSGALPVRVALTSIDNLSANPRYDHLDGILRGVLLYDLAEADGIEIVNHGDLESILREQEVQLSSLSEDRNKALEVGRVLGADYLLRGEYDFLGLDALVTVRLLEVQSARSLTFSERGASENTLHAIAEAIIYRLTGREVTLQSELKERSIISFRKEQPGSIALSCNLIDAEILLDGQFIGYASGDPRAPFEIEALSPGTHTVGVRLPDYGVVKEPEITFHDWEQRVEVPPGKRVVVQARIRHFNDTLYNLSRLLWEEIDLWALRYAATVSRRHDASFVGRDGKKVEVLVRIEAQLRGSVVTTRAIVQYQGEEREVTLSCGEEDREKIEEKFDTVSFSIALDRGDVTYRLWRTDLHQDMFRERR